MSGDDGGGGKIRTTRPSYLDPRPGMESPTKYKTTLPFPRLPARPMYGAVPINVTLGTEVLRLRYFGAWFQSALFSSTLSYDFVSEFLKYICYRASFQSFLGVV